MANDSLILDVTWNTAGAPTAVQVNVTDTASDPASKLMDLKVGAVSKFSVDKGGNAAAATVALGGATPGTNALAVTGTAAISGTVTASGAALGGATLGTNAFAVTGTAAISGAVAAGGVAVGGATLGTNALAVTGTAAISTGLAIGGATLGTNALAVTGTAAVSGTISVNGTTALAAPGGNNHFFGPAGNLTLTGQRNTAVGASAAVALTSANDTTALGYSALTVATADNNTAVGSSGLGAVTSGADNTALGYKAGLKVTTGTSNVFLGSGAGNNASQKVNAVNSVALGYNTWTTSDNQVVLGNPDITQTILRGEVLNDQDLERFGVMWPANNNYFFACAGPTVEPTGHDNQGFGFGALISVTTGVCCTAMGLNALGANTTGIDMSAFGAGALQSNVSGVGCTAIGRLALAANTAGGNNTGLGDTALEHNTTGVANTAAGYSALAGNTTGRDNSALGLYAGGSQTTASRTTSFGSECILTNVTGNDNTAIGYRSTHLTTGEQNTGMGSESLRVVGVGSRNAGMGFRAGYRFTSGDDNVFVGANSGADPSQKLDPSNSIAIGANTFTTASNQVVIGDTNITQTILRGQIDYGSGPATLSSPAAAVHQFGAPDAAAPVAQTLQSQSVAAGTSDTAGANLVIRGSRGTGTGAGGSIVFGVAPVGSSGSTQNAYADAVTITSDRNVAFAADLGAAGGASLYTGTAPPAGGTAGTGLKLSSTANLGVFFGSGAPTLAAAQGSLYLRTDGSGTGDRAYINTDGSTGWTALTTAA